MKTRYYLFFVVLLTYIFQTAIIAQPISDDFYPETTIQSPWTFYDPVGDATLTLSGTNAEISVPSGTNHDLWTGGGNKAPRMLQPTPNTDFQIEVKFESVPSATYQLQGLIVQEDNDTFIRIGTYYGNGPKLFVSVINGGTLVQTPTMATINSIPTYLRISRVGDNWDYEYSFDGNNWNIAASFTQVFTVNQTGFYAGNAGGNPAFTASADYFINTANPINDSDIQGVTPPTLEVWYGENQTFGNLGNPQKWINILGNVSDDNGMSGLTYSLNGGSAVNVSIGADGKRLVKDGDFVTEIDYGELTNGSNTLEFTATDALGAQTTKSITLNYNSGNVWPLPYSANFKNLNSIDNINSVANIVDGLWELTSNGIRTTETGYDRLIVLGDETWTTNYEATAEMTIHSVSGSNSGVGFAIGWQGHEGNNSPRINWPLEAIGWVRNFPNSSLRILTYTDGIKEQMNVSLSPDTKYLLKSRSEDIGGGLSRFSVKIWEEGTTEPNSFMITADVTDRKGSILLITHKADVTWGSVAITPITGNQSPIFTSSPITNAQVGNQYTYNITVSDPNVNDLLSISAVSIPSWLTLTDNGNGTANLEGSPILTNIGSSSVELLVEDGNGGTGSQSFTISVLNGVPELVSDQFCDTNINPHWSLFDPYDSGADTQTGESSFSINNGAFEIAIPGNEESHDLSQNLAPRVLQTIPDEDFGVEVLFNSIPSEQFQMQGIVVQTSSGARLRFETYYGSSPFYYANSYGIPFGSAAVNRAIGDEIPPYQKLVRTGNVWQYDCSYDGIEWTNVVTTTIVAEVTEVGFYGANHTPNPEFTLSVEYFRNILDPVPSCGFVEVSTPNGGETLDGGDPYSITWTSSELTNINIEFSPDDGITWSTVISGINASLGSYEFVLPNINSSDCLIRISNAADPSIDDISDNSFEISKTESEPTITIGSANSTAGSYVTIPVYLDATNDFEVGYLLQGKINYDASKLKFLHGYSNINTITNQFSWTPTIYSAIPGIIDVIISGATPMTGSGELFYLTFQIIDSNAGNTVLSSESNLWPVDVLKTPLQIENGTITYNGNNGVSENRGDATLDYVVDFYDALAVIYHWIGYAPLTGQALINADADFDEDVDIEDYLRIIFFVYLHDWNFSLPVTPSNSNITMNDAEINDDDLVIMPVQLNNADKVQTVELNLDYDNSKLEYLSVDAGEDKTNNLQSAHTSGNLSLVAVNLNEIKDGELAKIYFKKLDKNSTSELTISYSLNNGQTRSEKTISIGNSITNLSSNEKLPYQFDLYQNYPNPFNPTTRIDYSIPEAGFYSLNVYNVLGEKIAELVNNEISSGKHSVVFDATGLTSGMYIYILKGNNKTIVKKLLLLK